MQRVEQPAPPLPSVTRGTGPGLLLVHGGGATAQSTYGALFPALARDFAVVAPDYSQSSDGTSLSLDLLVDQHIDAAARAGHERFAMVGHSLGSMIAIRAAVRYPERVTALVLTAGFARAAMSTRLKVQVWRSLLEGNKALLPRYLMSVMLSDRYLAAMTDAQIDGLAELIGLTMRDDTAEQIELVLDLDLRADLDRVTVPTLVVATRADQLVPPGMSAELAEGIPGASFAALDCGHQPALECAPEWLRLIKDFLSARRSGS